VRPTFLCAQQHFSAPLSAARELHAGDTAIGDVSHGVVSVVSVVSVVVVVMVMLRHGDEVTGSARGAWWRRAGSTRRHWAHAGNKEKDVGVRQESSSECVCG
jgi:hypothetical protein